MTTKTNGTNGHARTPHIYKSYDFRERDPVIELARTVVQSSHLSMKQIHERSSVSTTTFYGWFGKKKQRTRRPQFATVAATLLACGVKNIDLAALRRKAS